MKRVWVGPVIVLLLTYTYIMISLLFTSSPAYIDPAGTMLSLFVSMHRLSLFGGWWSDQIVT